MTSNPVTIGIIGTGRFGTVLARLFNEQGITVKLASRSKPVDNATIFPLPEVISCDYIFPAIPISSLQPWLKQHSRSFTSCTGTWISVCSVMVEPIAWLKKYLPSTCNIIGSHPIFGPTSSKQGTDFSKLPWVFEGVEQHEPHHIDWLLEYLRNKGMVIHQLSAQEHDRIMARSQAVAFLFGSIGQKLQFNEGPFDTVGFQHLMANQRIYEQDSHQLLLDMFQYNRYAREMLRHVREVINDFSQEVLGDDE